MDSNKKSKIGHLIKIVVFVLGVGISFLIYFLAFKKQIDNLTLIYLTNYNIWFKNEADRVSVLFVAILTIVVSLMFIAFIVIDLVCLDKNREAKIRNIIILVVILVLSLCLTILFYTMCNNPFILSYYYYLYTAHFIVAVCLYTLTRTKARSRDKQC